MSESDRCRLFERGLKKEIHTPITVITKLTYFSQIVETALRVKQSLEEVTSVVGQSLAIPLRNNSRRQDQRHFIPGVSER